jgi:hypothetical protein
VAGLRLDVGFWPQSKMNLSRSAYMRTRYSPSSTASVHASSSGGLVGSDLERRDEGALAGLHKYQTVTTKQATVGTEAAILVLELLLVVRVVDACDELSAVAAKG